MVTRSPARMRMRCLRILPEAYAVTAWPLASTTRNIVLGSTSSMTPSYSTISSLAISGSLVVGRRGAGSRSDCLQIDGGRAAVGAAFDVERDLLGFGQCLYARAFPRRNMHEHVFWLV